MPALGAVVVYGVRVGDIDHKGIRRLSARRRHITRVEAAIEWKARAFKGALDNGVVLGFQRLERCRVVTVKICEHCV